MTVSRTLNLQVAPGGGQSCDLGSYRSGKKKETGWAHARSLGWESRGGSGASWQSPSARRGPPPSTCSGRARWRPSSQNGDRLGHALTPAVGSPRSRPRGSDPTQALPQASVCQSGGGGEALSSILCFRRFWSSACSSFGVVRSTACPEMNQSG